MTYDEIVKRLYSLDDFDYSSVASKYPAKVCEICGKEFVPTGRNGNRQRFCKRSHYIDCLVCGKPVLQVEPSLKPDAIRCTCSKLCANKYRSQRTKEVLLEKYGVENVSQVPEIHEKQIAGIRAKSAQTTEKIKAVMQEKYGGMGTASPVLRAKIEGTMQEKYGITNPDESPEFRKKISEALKSDKVIQKKIKNSRIKYGTDYPAQSEIVQLAMQETCMKHYGVPFSGMIPEAKEKAKRTCEELYGVPYALLTEKARRNAVASLAKNPKGYRISKLNLRFEEFFKEKGIELEREFYLERSKSADFRVAGTDVLIEIDPAYTHSDLPNHWNSEGLPPSAQLDRTELIESKGYRCVHVFDWDDWDKIAAMFTPKQTIYARNCILESIKPEVANKFLDQFHLQNHVRGTKFAYGLYYNDTLVSVMTFGKPRYNKNYEWELLRLCSHADYRITGGAARMFSQFIKDANPSSVISYCDRAKFKGEVYNQLGFSLHHVSDPAKVWVHQDKKGYITDNYLRTQGFDRIFNTNYGKGTSNEALIIRKGYRSVYDCGQLVFEWRSSENLS